VLAAQGGTELPHDASAAAVLASVPSRSIDRDKTVSVMVDKRALQRLAASTVGDSDPRRRVCVTYNVLAVKRRCDLLTALWPSNNVPVLQAVVSVTPTCAEH
jgi:hypothetical protein